MRRSQLRFSFDQLPKGFGGERYWKDGRLKTGKAKIKRAVAVKSHMHVILRSSRAKGEFSLLSHSHRVQGIINRQGEAHFVQILSFANVGNHLHLLVRAQSRKGFLSFLKAISGLIPRYVLNAHKGRPAKMNRFWDAIPYTRIVQKTKDLWTVKKYIVINQYEGRGIPRTLAKQILSRGEGWAQSALGFS